MQSDGGNLDCASAGGQPRSPFSDRVATSLSWVPAALSTTRANQGFSPAEVGLAGAGGFTVIDSIEKISRDTVKNTVKKNRVKGGHGVDSSSRGMRTLGL